MRAAVFTETGQWPVWQTIEPQPCPEGWEEVHIKAAALNHRDVWICLGKYPGIRVPMVLGSDGAGEYNRQPVIILPSLFWGDKQSHPDPAFQILGLPTFGCLAERVYVPKQNIYPKPDHLSFEEAAALPLAGLTAWRALFSKAQVTTNDKVLITGIGGGVALFALQFAVAAGAEVWVTSSDDKKIERAKELGAKGGFNYRNQEYASVSGEKGFGGETPFFTVIIDGAGGAGFATLIKVAAPAARVVIYGGTAGAFENLIPQAIFWKQIQVMGTTMGSDADFSDMLRFVNHHRLIPIVDSVRPAEQVHEAFEKLHQGGQFGKVVLSV